MVIPDMVYSPQLQLMVKPETENPVFSYSRSLQRGKSNGEYQVAPLVTKVTTSSNCAVTREAEHTGPDRDPTATQTKLTINICLSAARRNE